MSGRVGDLSPKQTQALETFRENVRSILLSHHDDYFLLRWLRARNFNIQKAENMLRASTVWRKHNNIDNILNEKHPEVLRRYFTGGCCGVDKEGHPVRIDPVGRLDLQGIMRSSKKSEILRYKIYQVECVNRIMEEQTKKLGKNVEQETVIVDVENVGTSHLWKPAINLYTEMVKLVEDNYPERLKMVLVVNAPALFPILWRITKPFLAEKTAKKIEILGGNYQSKLLQYIPADQLPAAYGGTMVGKDGDPHCGTMIVWNLSRLNITAQTHPHDNLLSDINGVLFLPLNGGQVPKEYYTNLKEIDKDRFTEIYVGRGSSCEIEVSVPWPETILSWQYISEGFDIAFGIYRRTESWPQKTSDMEKIVQSQRTDSHVFPVDGCVVCFEPDVLVFDNTYSYTRGKKVFYTCNLLESSGHLIHKQTEITSL